VQCAWIQRVPSNGRDLVVMLSSSGDGSVVGFEVGSEVGAEIGSGVGQYLLESSCSFPSSQLPVVQSFTIAMLFRNSL
jgi:hypothetical protein